MQSDTGEFRRRFRYDQASAAELQAVVDEVLAELRDPTSEAVSQARLVDLNPQVLANSQVGIREEKQGFEPISTTILVSIVTGAGTHIATKFWDEVIWPRLRKSLGAKAVGDEVKE